MRRLGGMLLVAVALGALAGCRSTSSADPPPAPLPPPSALPSVAVEGQAQGLDIRYLGPDGTTKTLKVEDFPR